MPEYYYPDRMGRIILLAMEEVVGGEAARVLGAAASLGPPAGPPSGSPFTFQRISLLMQAFEKTYGIQAGRGTALRIGRACFTYGLREYGSLLGITEMAFRLLPLPGKFRRGADLLAGLFNRHTDQRVRVEEQEDRLIWHIQRCPLCWERRTSEPACHLAVGLLQESLYWLSGGRQFDVEEIDCIAQGASTCAIVIDKTPIS